MSYFPDLSNTGYLIQQVLGQNHESGWVTYLAISGDPLDAMVLKK